MDLVVTSLVDYYVSVAVILSRVLQKFALWALGSLLGVKSPPVPKAGLRSVHHLSLAKPWKWVLKCYNGLLSTEVNCILCEQWDFQFSLRLFVSAAVRIRMGSLNLLKTFDAHPSEARALQLSDLTTAESGKRQLFDVDGHRTHLVWIFKVFQSHIVNYRGSSVSSNMHWLTAETSEHSQIFIFGKLNSSSSCLLDRWRNWGVRWTGDFQSSINKTQN